MTFQRVNDISTKSYAGGQFWESSFRKTPANAAAQGIWSDLSGAPGNPKPNYYTGAELEFTTLDGAAGLYHGGNVAPAQKRLHKVLIGSTAAVSPATFMLCDYLGFYPLIDMDSTDEQPFTNPTALPRYSDGAGVEAILVATNPYIGGAQFFVNYTGADGAQRQSLLETSNTATFIGTVVNNTAPTVGGAGLFLRRSADCRGIRSVDSITFLSPNGGLAALVLVKPLARIMTNENTAYAEYDFATMRSAAVPRILDGAYLNMFCSPNASLAAAPINGLITSIWN